MGVHHAEGISRQRNSGCRPSRVNIMAQSLSTPDPSVSPTHLSIRRRSRNNYTLHIHHQVNLMVSRNITLVSFWGLCIGSDCEASLNAGMRREHTDSMNKWRTNSIDHTTSAGEAKYANWPYVPRGPMTVGLLSAIQTDGTHTCK